MLSTKSLISDLMAVPTEWVFEYYLQLSEKLVGQDLMVKSVFNPKDKKPSLHVYPSSTTKKYRYKDFSSDKGGDCIDLVVQLFGLSTRGEAGHKIIEDYNEYLLNNNHEVREFKIRDKYKVTGFVKRQWTTLDAKYWQSYNISSKLLEYYHVAPLEGYRMERTDEDGGTKTLDIQGLFIYGYFRMDGTLYKIYQPKVAHRKFIKVKDYIQGSDQLTYEKPYLVITSSMKDLLTLARMNFDIEIVAPDSENTLIRPQVLQSYQTKFKRVCTLFDNDDPGVKAMEKYKAEYGIPYVHLEMEKDISDSVKAHGLMKTKETVYPLLKNALKS